MLSDTSPEAERVQIELLRRAGPGRRAELMSSLTNSCIQRAKASVRRAYPDADEVELQRRYIALQYDPALADAYANYVRRSGA